MNELSHWQFRPCYLQIIVQYHPVMRRCRFCVTNVVEKRQLKQPLSFMTTMFTPGLAIFKSEGL
jgi:hypothetical protein